MRNNQKPANLFANIEKDENGNVTKERPYYIRNKNIIVNPDDGAINFKSINEAKKYSRKLIKEGKVVYRTAK